MRLFITTCLFSLVVATVCAVSPESINLDDVMTKQEQKQTGIVRLSSAERAQLQIWLTNWTLKLYTNLARNPNMKPGDLAVFGQNLPSNENYNPQGQILLIDEIYDDGEMLRMADGSIWKVAQDSRDKSVKWQVGHRVTVYRSSNPSNPFRLVNLATRDSVDARVEFGPNATQDEAQQDRSVRRLDAVDDNGGILILDDGSRWKVSPWDKFKTKLWLADERIKIGRSSSIVYPYSLKNLESNEAAECKQLSAGHGEAQQQGNGGK